MASLSRQEAFIADPVAYKQSLQGCPDASPYAVLELAKDGWGLWTCGCATKLGDASMPTSRQDPAMAKRQRGSVPPAETAKEWLPLWLAGPVVALVAIVGLIGICIGIAEVYAWLR